MGQKVKDMFAYHLVPTVQYTEMARNEKMCGGRVKFCFNPVLGDPIHFSALGAVANHKRNKVLETSFANNCVK